MNTLEIYDDDLGTLWVIHNKNMSVVGDFKKCENYAVGDYPSRLEELLEGYYTSQEDKAVKARCVLVYLRANAPRTGYGALGYAMQATKFYPAGVSYGLR